LPIFRRSATGRAEAAGRQLWEGYSVDVVLIIVVRGPPAARAAPVLVRCAAMPYGFRIGTSA
jgi:hypothetical protein